MGIMNVSMTQLVEKFLKGKMKIDERSFNLRPTEYQTVVI